MNLPLLLTNGRPCTETSEFRRSKRKAEFHARSDIKRACIEDLLAELESRGVRSMEDISKKFTKHENNAMMCGSLGVGWENVAKSTLKFIENERLDKEKSLPYLQKLIEYPHECEKTPITDGVVWLEDLFTANEIDGKKFMLDAIKVLDMAEKKVNAFAIVGPANSGKSLIVDLMTNMLTCGTVSRRGEQSAFVFDNLLDSAVALMEEPRIVNATVNDFKYLLGGQKLQVDVKHQKKQWLHRIPVMISSNTPIGALVSGADRLALEARVVTYRFRAQIQSSLVKGKLRQPPYELCSCHLVAYLKKIHIL